MNLHAKLITLSHAVQEAESAFLQGMRTNPHLLDQLNRLNQLGVELSAEDGKPSPACLNRFRQLSDDDMGLLCLLGCHAVQRLTLKRATEKASERN